MKTLGILRYPVAMAFILFLLVVPVVLVLGVWHYSGYMAMMGEPLYDRLAREKEENR